MNLARQLETQLGTLLPLQEPLSQLMLWQYHTQDMLSISNTLETLHNSTLDHRLITIPHMSQPTMPIQRFSIVELKLPQLSSHKLHQLIQLLQKLSDGTNQHGMAQDQRLHLVTLLNLIQVHPSITIHHTSQLIMPIQRFSIVELKLPQLSNHKLHQLIQLLQKLLDGTNQHGMAQDQRLLSETLFNLMPSSKLKVSLDKDSVELLTSRSLQLPTLALMLTKLPPMMKLAQLMEIQLGIPLLPQEPLNQLTPWLNHTQDTPRIEKEKTN